MRLPDRPLLLLASLVTIALAGCLATRPAPTPTSEPGTATPPPAPATTSATPTASPAATAAPVDLAHLTVNLRSFALIDGSPLAIAAPDDGSGRLFVVTQDGRIWIVSADGKVDPSPMVDLGKRLTSGGEQGLLGLALHPGFPTDPRVYVNYTNKDGDTVIASLTLDPANPNRLDPDSQQRILFVDQPYANHNGGNLLFGPDGYLYAFFGDGGSGGDPQGNGQNPDVLLGKILRLDVDHPNGGDAYTSPAGNPFVAGGGRPEIWLTGVRNPWRDSFDRATGDLWIGDVGQGAWEEVDVARAGVGGLNLGWNRMEGNHCYKPDTGCDQSGLTAPVTEYGHDLGCTVVGGYVYRGIAQPALAGVYLFADYCSGRIFAIDPSTDTFREPVQVGNGRDGITSFGEDTAGELYITHVNGDVSRIVASAN
jgi:glucose/arabinose dehydrogenase